MKKLLLAVTVSAFCILHSAFAQTNSSPQSTFFDAVTSYFSSLNTNLDGTFSTHKGAITLGAVIQDGAHSGLQLRAEYKIWKGVGIESVSQFADVTGVLDTQLGGLNYSIITHDTKLTGFVRGGYRLEEYEATCQLGLRVEKALTEHTFAGMEIFCSVEKGTKPGLTIFTGFTF